MGAQHVIELNGKRYDTTTGKLVDSATKTTAKPAPQPRKSTGSVDGIHRQKHRTVTPHVAPKKHVAAPANHTKRKTQRSQTLMRGAIHAQPIITDTQPAGFLSAQDPRVNIDTQRLQRAKAIHQNKFIGRFEAKATPAMPAAAPPIVAAPVVAAPDQTAPQESVAAPTRLESAIAEATSHEQQSDKHKDRTHHKIARKIHVKPRTLSIASVAILTLAIGRLVVHQNMPKISFNVAAKRAGVSGAIPAYSPAGYHIQKDIGYAPGQVTLTFASNTDSRNYTVTQTKTFWTSESLRENYLETLSIDYQTIQQNGKTVYLYGSNATWVDAGVWYRVEAKDASLSSIQLTNIINSL